MNEHTSQTHDEWLRKVAVAESMIPIVGRLYRERNVVTHVHGRRLVNQSAIEIVKAHRFARHVSEQELSLEYSSVVLQRADALNIRSASLDLGTVLEGISSDDPDFLPLIEERLHALQPRHEDTGPRDVVLYGFGRIGRLLARILLAHAGKGIGLRLRAIVVRKGSEDDLDKRASLLRRDSVHGPFEGTITVDHEENTILANGTLIHVIYSNDPATVDYTPYGIEDAIVVDNTGRWRDEEGLGQHLRATGVSRVLLTAPGKSPLKNIVAGVNTDDILPGDRIITAASCTTNAITPVLQVIDESYGVVRGHVETVHSFTNDQNLIDNFHKGPRRGRSAALNLVITETGAAKAVAKALPQLAGKLTGNAIRVPTPDVSLAILNLQVEKPVDRDALNRHLREVSLTGELRPQIDYIESGEVVSTDFVGSNRAGIVDGLATIAQGDSIVLYVWYDNEYGYSSQVIRVLEDMAAQSIAAS